MKPSACPECRSERIFAEQFPGAWSCYCYDCRHTWIEQPEQVGASEWKPAAQPGNIWQPSIGGKCLHHRGLDKLS